MIKSIPISLFSNLDSILHIYGGFSSFQECEMRLASYNQNTLIPNNSNFLKLNLAIYSFYIVLLEKGYYLVGYDVDGRAIVSGKDVLFCMIDGYWHTTDISNCDAYGKRNGIPYASLPYHFSTCCKALYPNDTLAKTIRKEIPFLVFRHSTQDDLLQDPWLGTSSLNEHELGFTVARILFSTMIECMVPFGTDFSLYFSVPDVKKIESLPLSDLRICKVNPFLCEVQFLNGIVEKKAIFPSENGTVSISSKGLKTKTFEQLRTHTKKNNILTFSAQKG